MDNANILIIDDNHIFRKMVRLALTCEGYTVDEAATAKSAIEYLHKNKPQLVLQDLVLPDMDGYDLNIQMNKICHDKNMPILALSGFSNKMDSIQEQGARFDTFILKPIEPSNLVKVVNSFFQSMSKPAVTPASGNKHILLLQDTPLHAKLLSLQLKQRGYIVSTVSSTTEALAKLEETMPAAIICNLFIQDMDAFEFCRVMRHHDTYAQLPFFLISSCALSHADIQFARNIGVSHLLTWDVGTAEIINKFQDFFLADKPDIHSPDSDRMSESNFHNKHVLSLCNQFKNQIQNHFGLSNKIFLQPLPLAMLEDTAASYLMSVPTFLWKNLLTACLRAFEFSRALFILKSKEGFSSIEYSHGCNPQEEIEIEALMKETSFFEYFAYKKNVVNIPSEFVTDTLNKKILDMVKSKYALIIPLSAGDQTGIFILSYSEAIHPAAIKLIISLYAFDNQLINSCILASHYEKISSMWMQCLTFYSDSSFAMAIHTKDGTILSINPEAEQLLEMSKQQALGKNLQKIFDPQPMWALNAKNVYSETLLQPVCCNLILAENNHQQVNLISVQTCFEDESIFFTAIIHEEESSNAGIVEQLRFFCSNILQLHQLIESQQFLCEASNTCEFVNVEDLLSTALQVNLFLDGDRALSVQCKSDHNIDGVHTDKVKLLTILVDLLYQLHVSVNSIAISIKNVMNGVQITFNCHTTSFLTQYSEFETRLFELGINIIVNDFGNNRSIVLHIPHQTKSGE